MQTMMRYTNYNADATQSQHKRKCNAERNKSQKNSSKNSEPLLSLLDLSEHKNWGVTLLISIVVQAVNLYISHATSNKPRPLSRQSLATHATFSLFPILSPLASCAACDASDPSAVHSWLDASAPRVLVTSSIESFGSSRDPMFDP